MKTYTNVLAIVGTAALFSAVAFAQEGSLKAQLARAGADPSAASAASSSSSTTTPDDYYVEFFRNAQAEYFYYAVDLVDPGTNGTGDICADIYVVTPDEELAECCGVLLTPDELYELGVYELTENPANGKTVDNGAIKLISSAPGAGGTCDPGKPTPTAALRAWKTVYGGPYELSDNAFLPATLSTAEVDSLSSTCAFIEKDLSGSGICNTITDDARKFGPANRHLTVARH